MQNSISILFFFIFILIIISILSIILNSCLSLILFLKVNTNQKDRGLSNNEALEIRKRINEKAQKIFKERATNSQILKTIFLRLTTNGTNQICSGKQCNEDRDYFHVTVVVLNHQEEAMRNYIGKNCSD